MRRALTGFLITTALAGSVMAGTFSNGLERFVAGKSATESITVLLAMREQGKISELDLALHERQASLAERHQLVVTRLMDTATATQAELLAQLKALKAEGKVNGYTPYWIVNGVVVNAPISVLRTLVGRSDVDVAEVNLVAELIDGIKLEKVTDPPGGAERVPEIGVQAINAPDVWNILGVTGTGAIVGGIDTGVLGTHTSLAPRWRGNNGHPVSECWLDAAGFGDVNPADGHGHGTHTMGTMVGGAPGLETGVAPGAQWIASNCINMGTGAAFDNAVIASFQFMADPDGNPGTIDDVPDVVQNSWGVNEGFAGYFDCDTRWWAAVDNCEAAGVCVTWSAGNEGPGAGTLRSPADRCVTPYSCFSVGATDPAAANVIASFSSRGPSTCSPAPYPIKPEVSAPGVNTYSCYNDGGYTTMSGTSMAGPHVAGVVALMRSANPNVDVQTIKQILMDTCTDMGTVGEDQDYGHGLVNAYLAVQAVMSGYGTLSGTVTDASTAMPIAGALVDNTAGPQQVNTNGLGQYSMMFPEGTYDMQYSAFGYTAQTLNVSIVADATTTRNVALSPAPSDLLYGYVYGPDALPIVGATIDFTNAPIADLTTGAGGYYSATIPTGYTYDLTATAAGVGSQSQTVFFGASQQLDFNLPINPQFLPSGPDTYGYRIFDSNDSGGVPYDGSLDIAGTLAVTGDDATVQLTVPFNFNFYGTTYNQLSVCTNGWVSPGSTFSTTYSNGTIPDAGVPGAIYGQWDDLYASAAPNAVYYEYQPALGRFVVEWDHMSYCCSGGAGPVWMQIILLDPTIYPSPSGDAQWIVNFGGGDRQSHSTGIDNMTATDGIQYVANNVFDVNASPFTNPIALYITTNPNGAGPVQYPNVAVAPPSVDETVDPGGTASDIVTVTNTGDGTATWNATVTMNGMLSAVPHLELAKGQADPRVGEAGRNAGGPDTFGYSWIDSNEPGGPAFNWVDISGIGTVVGNTDDTNYGPFNLGFTFSYYGTNYTSVQICTNGWLSFTSTSNTLSPQGIPDPADPNALLAVMMRDLNPGAGGSLKYYVDGSTRFIVQWTGVPVYGTSDFQTFQVIINADGTILYQYLTVVNATFCSVGIENAAGTDGLQTAFNTAYLVNNLAVSYSAGTPIVPWLSIAPSSGTVPAGGSGTFAVNYNAASYLFGTFTGQVNFHCNDPDTPNVTIPVTMIVSGVDNGPPTVTHTSLTDTENTVGPYTVSANITDLSGIASATLYYQLNGGGYVSAAMSGGPIYSASIPGQPFVTTVDYYIVAVDASANNNTATTPTYTFQVVDNSLPVIVHTPLVSTQDTAGPYTVNANITDNTAVTATLSYRINGGSWTNVGMTGGPAFTADIPGPRPIGTVIDYYLTAVDSSPANNTATTPTFTFSILAPTGLEYCQLFEAGLGDWTEVNYTIGNTWTTQYFDATHNNSAYIQYGSTTQEDHAALISPVFDCSGQATINLDFWMQLHYGYGSYWTDAYVRGSTDGGVTWTQLIAEWHAGVNDPDVYVEGNFSYDLTAWAAGQPNVKIMFEYADLYDWTWYVDEVCMTGTLLMALPVDLDIAYIGAGQAQLSWVAVPNATSYDIYSAPSLDGTFTLLANTTGTSYVVATPSPDKRLYRVVTRNDVAATASVHPSNVKGYGVRPPTPVEARMTK